MRSRDVQLLGSRKRGGKLHWLRHCDYWLVSLGQAGLLALAPAGERWTVLRLDRDQVKRLAVDVDLGYAHRSAPSWPTAEPDTTCFSEARRASPSRTRSGSDGAHDKPYRRRPAASVLPVPT